MGRALYLLDVLSDAFRGVNGFRVDYLPGWESRGRDQLFPRGIMNHHIGAAKTTPYDNQVRYMGLNSSIAPLCNIATSRPQNGVVRITIVASGKANHAGRGYLPWIGTDKGNYYTIGFENENDGYSTWPDQQVEGIARANAALVEHLSLPLDHVVDHKTYAPGRKSDRVHVNVDAWRDVVRRYTQAGGGWKPPTQEDDEVVVNKGDKNKMVERVQKDINQVLTFIALGPDKVSINPRDGVGIKVDGDYGTNTANAVKEMMKKTIGVDVSGDKFGSWETYAVLRFGYYADDKRHEALRH